MRLPKESQLSKEQKEVCYAPSEGTAIVVGPPGSGKTIVALFRTKSLAKGGHSVATVMYNKVLSRYAGESKTFLAWLKQLWRHSTGRPFPVSIPEGHNSWPPLDYQTAAQQASSSLKTAIRAKAHWGHLIIDEAQDFEPAAHRLLEAIQNKVFADVPDAQRPSILILADENQRITPKNSTIEDLLSAYMLPRRDLYLLGQNYRNTREVARFASQFFNDARSGMPALPVRRGDPPKVALTKDLDDAVDRIATHVRLHENQETGVLVHHEKTRKKIFNKLKHRLGTTSVRVQTYSSQDKTVNDAGSLEFDTPGVTVLCFASCKGLEFDAVFLPELQSFPMDSENRDVARMTLYVMTSRARESLCLLLTDPARVSDFWKVLRPLADDDETPMYVLEE